MAMRFKGSMLALGLLLAVVLPARAGTLLVANKTDHTVDLVNATSGKSRATLPTGRAPHGMAYTSVQ